jgi:hypothetical protein
MVSAAAKYSGASVVAKLPVAVAARIPHWSGSPSVGRDVDDLSYVRFTNVKVLVGEVNNVRTDKRPGSVGQSVVTFRLTCDRTICEIISCCH